MFVRHKTKTAAVKILIGFFIISPLSFSFGAEDAASKGSPPYSEEQLLILEEYMRGEDDSNHVQAVEDAVHAVILALQEGDEPAAWRAFEAAKQGLTKSEEVRKWTVRKIGEIIQEADHEEIFYEASFSLEQSFYFEESEEVLMGLIDAAELIVIEAESEETAQKFLNLIIQKLDHESDRIQVRILKALAKIARRTDADIALQALSAIESSKSIQSEKVKEIIVDYAVGKLVRADNETIRNQSLSLLEWGMTQSENIQKRTVSRAVKVVDRARGAVQDRAFGVLRRGFSASEEVRNRAEAKTVDLFYSLDEEDAETKSKLLAFLEKERVSLDNYQEP